jgi:hypothetical protein
VRALLIGDRIGAVWAGLILATIASSVLGAGHGPGPHRPATSAVLVVAFVKVRFVGLYFMELRSAPVPLRWVFEAWVVVVCALLLGLYLGGG